jgi:L-lysine exporter family protein LysE/ArgO
MHAFWYGVILAFGLIIPLGIQNIFIINQGASQPKWVQTIPGVLTAFICDALLISGAVMGVSLAVLSIPLVKTIFYYVGLVFLIYMGWVTWRSSSQPTDSFQPLSSRQQIYFAASVSLLNPHAVLDSVAVIGTNSLHFIGTDKWLFTFACILVSFCWFVGLSLIGRLFKQKESNHTALKWLNKFSALTIWAVAIYIAKQMLQQA